MRRKLAWRTGAVVGAMVGGALMAACSTIRDHRGYIIDPALVDSVQPGIDNRASVERTLGRPTFVSQFGLQSWYYVAIDSSQRPFKGPRAVKETVLRVRFDARDNVAAIDRSGVDKVVRIRPDGASTPTLGRDRNFFEDLFGNIGTVGAGGGGGGPGGGGPGGGGGGGGAPGGGPNGS